MLYRWLKHRSYTCKSSMSLLLDFLGLPATSRVLPLVITNGISAWNWQQLLLTRITTTIPEVRFAWLYQILYNKPILRWDQLAWSHFHIINDDFVLLVYIQLVYIHVFIAVKIINTCRLLHICLLDINIL